MNTYDGCTDILLYSAMKATAQKYPDRPAIDFLGTRYTYRELLENIEALAASLLHQGVKKADRVALCLPNSPQAIIALYALNRIGATAVLLNPLSSPHEMITQLQKTQCKGLFILDYVLPSLAKNLRHPKSLDFVVIVSLLTALPLSLSSLRAFVRAFPRLLISVYFKHRIKAMRWNELFKQTLSAVAPENDPLSEAVIVFSAGTSGEPKAVVLSSKAINAGAMQCLATEPPIEEGMSLLAVLPFFHIFGLTIAIHLPLLAGGCCLLMPRFNADQAARVIVEKKPTYLAGVPTIYEGLLDSPYLQRASQLGNLDFRRFRLGFCGGDRLHPSSLQRFNALIAKHQGQGRIVEGYGLTESCPVTVMPRDGTGPLGSLGKAIPPIDICIVHPGTSELLAPNQEGEICVSARSLMSSYLHEPRETKKVLWKHVDGTIWFHTGDMGSLDDEGFLFFTTRQLRLLKVSGYTVSALQVETVLKTHPRVEEACVVGIPCRYALQRVKAYVVVPQKWQHNKTRQELIAHCRKNLSPWSVPKEIEFRDQLPLNLLGKISWGKLV